MPHMERKMHLVDDFPYTRTMCGKLLREVGEDWTDDVIAVAQSPNSDDCAECVKVAKRQLKALNDAERHEWAMEEGMLQGIDAYNEIMGGD